MTELFDPENLTLNHRRKTIVLSGRLVEYKKPDALRVLILHNEKLDLFDALEDGEVDPGYAVAELERIEFCLQSAWGLGRHNTMHRWWEIPGCACPKLANQELLGLNIRRTEPAWKLHGTKSNPNPWI